MEHREKESTAEESKPKAVEFTNIKTKAAETKIAPPEPPAGCNGGHGFMDTDKAKHMAANWVDDGRCHYGYKFIQWVVKMEQDETNKTEEELLSNNSIAIQKYLPPIDIGVKIYNISAINLEEKTFESVFTVMLLWEDPSLVLSSDIKTITLDALTDHFVPSYRVENKRPDADHQTDYTPESGILRRYSRNSCVLQWTLKLHATLKADTDASNFPYDSQFLKYTFQVGSVAPKSIGDNPNVHTGLNHFPILQHPVRWFRNRGHTLEINADWTVNYDVIGINGCYNDERTYTVELAVLRDPHTLVYQLIVAQIATQVLGLCSYFIDDFQDAIALVVTALLSTVAAEFAMADLLPNITTATSLEVYSMFGLVLFILQGTLNLIIHMRQSVLEEQMGIECHPATDWWTSVGGKTANATDSLCVRLSWLSTGFFGCSFILLLVQHMYLAWRGARVSFVEQYVMQKWRVAICGCAPWRFLPGGYQRSRVTNVFATIQSNKGTACKWHAKQLGRSGWHTLPGWQQKRGMARTEQSPKLACHFDAIRRRQSDTGNDRESVLQQLCRDWSYDKTPIPTRFCLKHGERCVGENCLNPRTWIIGEVVEFECPDRRAGCQVTADPN